MKILISILTYNRPEMLRRLLEDIGGEAGGLEVVVRVYDDHSDPPVPLAAVDGPCRYSLISRPFHGGKKLFWEMMNWVLHDARRSKDWDRLLVLPDDVRLAPSFFARLEAAWAAVPCNAKLLLNPLMDARGPVAHWNAVEPVFVDRGPGLYRVGWNDGCWYAERRLVQAFHRFRPPSPARWHRPYVSTGVGDQFSRWAVVNGFTLWMVADSLLYHGDHPSQMHKMP